MEPRGYSEPTRGAASGIESAPGSIFSVVTDGETTPKRTGAVGFYIAIGAVLFILLIGWDLTGWDFYGWLLPHAILAPSLMLLGIPVVGVLIFRRMMKIDLRREYLPASVVLLACAMIVLLGTARTAIIDSRELRINNCWVIEGSGDSDVSGDSRWVCRPGSRPYTWSGFDTTTEEGSSRECTQVSKEPSTWQCETQNY